jgi:hypothetical protein
MTQLYFMAGLQYLLAVLVACHRSQPSPAETVKQIFTLVEGGHIDEATQLFSSRARQNLPEIKSLIAPVPAVIKNSGGVTVQIVNEEIIGETAIVTFDLRYGNGQIEHVTYKLIKENGLWRCDGSA